MEPVIASPVFPSCAVSISRLTRLWSCLWLWSSPSSLDSDTLVGKVGDGLPQDPEESSQKTFVGHSAHVKKESDETPLLKHPSQEFEEGGTQSGFCFGEESPDDHGSINHKPDHDRQRINGLSHCLG